jgi:ubiquinone biosynthesis protein
VLWEGLSAARDLGRVHDIASILIRYGFGDAVRRLGLSSALEKAGKVLRWKDAEQYARMESPQRACQALQDLGPTFLKLGQVLSTRVDLFSPEWITEFEKLQDRVSPVPFEKLRPQLEEDLGAPAEEVFPFLETQALAAASIAQVHRAQLADGTDVILKIRRPGIRSIVEADLRLLAHFAEMVEQEIEEMRRFRPRELVRQFSRSLRRELDLAGECRNAERIASNFTDDPDMVVPKVYWPWVSERLNVQEYIAGIPGRDLKAVDKAGLDRKLLAKRGANVILKMVLEDGFFYADPHPGNVFYLPGERIVFIDFGMVGHLSEERRYQVADLAYGLVERKAQVAVDVLLDWTSNSRVDTENLANEVDAFINQYHGVPLKQLNLTGLLTDLMALLREHQLSLPPDLALLVKALISLEGMGRQLDPDFDMASEAQPFLRSAWLARYSPNALAKRGWQSMISTANLLAGFPQDLRRLLASARRGALQVKVDVTRLENFAERLDRAASRLTVGNVTAALIIGSSIVMTVEGGPMLLGLPLFGLLGFAGAVIGGIWLLVSIWQSGKHKR